MTIGQRLREERVRLKLTQPQFAALGGVEKGAQIRYESGKGSPSASHLAAAAERGLDVLYVITGRREPGPNTKSISYLPTTAPHTTLREPPPKWGGADAREATLAIATQADVDNEFLAKLAAVLPWCESEVRDLILRLAHFGARRK